MLGEDFAGEATPRLPGEGQKFFDTTAPSTTEVIKEKKLTFEEASKCLNTLGKDETGSRYAYLMITATDRKLTDISIILSFKHILFLDVSGNFLTLEALQTITEMPFLILLKAERNRIESAQLKPMYYLQVLDLNQNQIKEIGNIDQPMLECLELSYNDIYSTNFAEAKLDNLRQLELRSNLLFDISGIYPEKIEKLYLAANKISIIAAPDFPKLPNLQILHLRENNIQKLNGFTTAGLINLKYINLRNNKIGKLKEFQNLQCLPKLETLIITGNPLPGMEIQQPGEGRAGFTGEGGPIRDPAIIPILVLLRNLKRINKTVITLEFRIEAEDLENEILEAMMADDTSLIEDEIASTTTNLSSEYKAESEKINEEKIDTNK